MSRAKIKLRLNMKKTYYLGELFAYYENGVYKISSANEINGAKQLIPLCSLFAYRDEQELAQFKNSKMTVEEIMHIEFNLNNLCAKNLVIGIVKDEKSKAIPMLLTWDGTGHDSPRRPYFPEYLSQPYLEYDNKHLICLSDFFNIKDEKINPMQVLFLHSVIGGEKFKSRFYDFMEQIYAEERKIKEAKKLIEMSQETKEQLLSHGFEKFELY